MVTAIEAPSVYSVGTQHEVTAGVEAGVGARMARCPFSSAPVKQRPVKLKNYCADKDTYDFLNQKSKEDLGCKENVCKGSAMFPNQLFNQGGKVKPKKEVLEEAHTFINQYYTDQNKYDSPEFVQRWQQVVSEVSQKGTYDLTYDELCYGAKHAWRNAPRCIGRMSWQKLEVFDCRHVTTTKEMYDAMCKHIEYGSNNGKLRSAITVFPQRTDPDKEFRVWNKQMFSYAGYTQVDGSVIGDPSNAEFTDVCMRLGWKGAGTRFDILPWVLQANGEDPDVYEVPKDIVLEVDITHPKYPWFADMGLKWYCLPGVSGMLLDCGGVEFCGAPFSGWYMVTEIAVRDLCDVSRYNIMEEVGKNMGLNTVADSTLWKDKAALAVTEAVMHSFHKKNVTIVDHHTAAESFMKHFEQETRTRGGCPTDWVWVVPPIGGSLTPVFHQEFSMYLLKPSYMYQVDRWKTHVWRNRDLAEKPRKNISFRLIAKLVEVLAKFYSRALSQRTSVTILYATETGRSQTYAQKLADIYSFAFNVKLSSMDDYDITQLWSETLLFIVASTTGNGDPPENAQKFTKAIRQMKEENRVRLDQLKYGVFALGSKAYKNYCSFGRWVDSSLGELGATRIQEIVLADELTGQDKPFKQFSADGFKNSCKRFCPAVLESESAMEMFKSDVSISKGRVRFIGRKWMEEKHSAGNHFAPQDYMKLHGKTVYQAKVSKVYKLHDDQASRTTIGVELKSDGSSDLDYKPGDHVAIFPSNQEHLVSEILSYMKDVKEFWDKPAQYQLFKEKKGMKGKWDDHDQLPSASIRTLLSQYLDITTPPSTELLESLATMTEDQNESNKLQELVSNPSKYEEWMVHKYPHLLEVFQEFPSAAQNMDSAVILGHLSVLKPRYYSVSSSSDLHYDEIHLTVAVVNYRTQNGKGPLHHGVCTNYLLNLSEGEHVTCYIRCAPSFRLPEDKSVPLVMVGPGSGIAPLRSFWQKRFVDRKNQMQKGEESKIGPLSLFVGSQRRDLLLYSKEIKKMMKHNVIQERHIALSREPGIPKTYVQHKMIEVADEVYDHLINEKGHIYVCGDNNMADDVQKTLQKIIQTEGGMSEEEAKEQVRLMKETKRYHEDLFGNRAPTMTADATTLPAPVVQQETIPVKVDNKQQEQPVRPSRGRNIHQSNGHTSPTATSPSYNGHNTMNGESNAKKNQGKDKRFTKRSVEPCKIPNISVIPEPAVFQPVPAQTRPYHNLPSPTPLGASSLSKSSHDLGRLGEMNGYAESGSSYSNGFGRSHAPLPPHEHQVHRYAEPPTIVAQESKSKRGFFKRNASTFAPSDHKYTNGTSTTNRNLRKSSSKKLSNFSYSTGDLSKVEDECEDAVVSTSRIKQALARCGMKL